MRSLPSEFSNLKRNFDDDIKTLGTVQEIKNVEEKDEEAQKVIVAEVKKLQTATASFSNMVTRVKSSLTTMKSFVEKQDSAQASSSGGSGKGA